MQGLIGALYIILGIIIICYEGFQLLNKKGINYITFFDLYFIAYYIIPGAIHNLASNYVSRYNFSFSYGDGTFTALFMVWLSYFAVRIGFRLTDQQVSLPNYKYKIVNEDSFFLKAIIVLWIIGLFSAVIYCHSYGGIQKALFNSNSIRNGTMVAEEQTSIFTTLAGKSISSLMYASYFAYIKFLNDRGSKTIFIFSIVLAAIYFILNAGRAAILTYLIVMVFINITLSEKKVKLSTWIMLFAFVLLGVSYLRPIFASMPQLKFGFNAFVTEFKRIVNSSSNTGFEFSNLIYKLCYSLEHKYVSLETAIRVIGNGKYSFNFFIDIIVALLAFVPSSFVPFSKPTPISIYNTEFMSNGFNTGTIPPGGIAFGYYALGLVGVVIYSYVIGFFGKRMISFFDSFDSKYISSIKFINTFVWVDFFINGELRQCVMRYCVFLTFLIILSLKKRGIQYND